MKKYFIITMISLLVFGLTAAEMAVTPNQMSREQTLRTRSGVTADAVRTETNANRDETIFYQQDFNSGWEGWYTVDATIPDDMWHLSDYEPYGGSGYSWWMADPELGGYRNNRYNVLDTPAILVTEDNSVLTFVVAYAMEEPDVHENYDGWDGANVRISTDGGETWDVISGSPAYDSNSLWSFGSVHGEGPGVPGWAGSSDGWLDAEFDLSSYIGQEVHIRFAFASDMYVDTATEPSWFGIKVDNISLGDYIHDFDDGEEHGMTYTSLLTVGGDLWHIGTPAQTPPTPPNAALAQNEEGTYNGNMLNYIVSPPITLPSSGDIRVDFQVRGDIHGDQATFPNCDYWGWEISVDGGTRWLAMSNPYGDPEGDNYVFIDAPEMWMSMVDSYQGVTGHISDYAGDTVKFRIYLRSIDHNPTFEGLMIDSYTIYHHEYLPTPMNLEANVDEQTVDLTWSAPGSGGGEGWIHWDSGTNADAVGAGGGTVSVAARFTAPDLENYVNGYITTMRMFPYEAAATYELNIWKGSTGQENIYSQPITSFTTDDWNEFELTEPVQILFGEEYWIGYTFTHLEGQFPAGCDAGPRVPNKGDMVRFDNGPWGSLFEASGGNINSNWNIQALVEVLDERVNIAANTLSTRQVSGFNVYHSTTSGQNYELIASLEGDETTYTDTTPETGMVNYYVVTALYEDRESNYSNEASAFVLPDTAYEHGYDDGTAETGFNAGAGSHVAVRFIPQIHEEAHLSHIRVYLQTWRTGTMVLKVFPEVDGAPATNPIAQFSRSAADLQEGWNTITVTPSDPVYLSEGFFYVAIQEIATSSAIGVDTDNVGSSYTKIGANPWSRYQNGNFMIRAILDGNTDVEQILEPAPQRLTVSNYPNPFNPETTIRMNIPNESEVTLSVYNLKGQLIETLVNDVLPAGNHSVVWSGKDSSGSNVSSGIYFYRVENEGTVINRRMILLK